MTLEEFKHTADTLPDGPGVYFFLGEKEEVLYIGKATSLRSRVRSYFSADLGSARGPLITSMVEKAKKIDWRETDSVLEALILEANLIKTYKPKHNTDLKDDKSFNHVVITKEDFPRVLLVRGKNLPIDFPPESRLHTFGPFPHGMQLKEALRIIRKIFPYRDTCIPCETAEQKDTTSLSGTKKCKPCFNASIGLCPGVCAGSITKTAYAHMVRRIVLLFQGKKQTLLASLTKDMHAAAKAEKFEEASVLRKQVFALEHIQDVSLIKDEYRNLGVHSLPRIEAYDTAHLQGEAAIGVMVVLEGGAPQKSEYRLFTLRETTPGDDTGALREILSRRLGHTEWPLPKLVVIDGGAAQLNVAHKVLREFGIEIPIVSVVKDEKHRPRGITGDEKYIAGREKDILLANAEAHRFAISSHRKGLRKKRLPR